LRESDVPLTHAFGTDDNFEDHYYEHVVKCREFGDIDRVEYNRLACEFMLGGAGPFTVERQRRESGRILRYDEESAEFGIRSPDGVIITYHKLNPAIHGFRSNLEYFEWTSKKPW
jgi:hypothetical protein